MRYKKPVQCWCLFPHNVIRYGAMDPNVDTLMKMQSITCYTVTDLP